MRDLISNVGTDYLVFAVSGILVLVVTLIYILWNDGNTSSLTCPGLKSSDPVLGNLGSLTFDGGIHKFLVENHKRFGPMFTFYWGKELAVSLACPILFKEVATLFNRPVNQFKILLPLIGKESVQYANQDRGKKLRQINDQHFSHSSIKSYLKEIKQVGAELCSKWASSENTRIPLNQNMLSIAFKTIIKTSFGPDYFKTNEEIIEIQALKDFCFAEMDKQLRGDFPEVNSKRENDFKAAVKKFKDKVRTMINHRRSQKIKSYTNFLDVMLEDDTVYTNDDQVVDNVIVYMIGGYHTTGNLLTWLVYFLCKHPEVESKVYNEMKEFREDDLDMELLTKFSYTKQVIDEVMRVAVLAPYAARYSDYDIIVDGHLIPKKTPIILALGAVFQDGTIFPDPERFDPDRFSDKQIEERTALAFQPFGFAGKRKCPGYRLAYAETLTYAFYIIKNFDISLVDKQSVKMQHGFVTKPSEEIWIKVLRRKNI
ncbi:cytochrome P450 20A1 isoform X2 [Hydra vulgaris]|uniref:Cytochrome P450 20A1 isoform X2 n=1 Tax=Hydra vulgaris TaxID=6087 RepID=A0ABM4CSY4_HYDVU